MIFFALVLMVIIGGAYTADCVFAESGEREVTLDIGVYSKVLKIFDQISEPFMEDKNSRRQQDIPIPMLCLTL